MFVKKTVHLPEKATSKILIGVSETTLERIRNIAARKGLTNTATVGLSIELLEQMIDDIDIVV